VPSNIGCRPVLPECAVLDLTVDHPEVHGVYKAAIAAAELVTPVNGPHPFAFSYLIILHTSVSFENAMMIDPRMPMAISTHTMRSICHGRSISALLIPHDEKIPCVPPISIYVTCGCHHGISGEHGIG